MLKLKIQNLTLTPVSDTDAKELFDLTDRNRIYLKEWLPWLDSIRYKKDSLSFIQKSSKLAAEGNSIQFAIRKQNELVGMIGLHHIKDKTRQPNIGYWIGEEYQGQGFITDACRRLIQYCFEELKLGSIQIACAVQNIKSQKVPQKLGFQMTERIDNAESLYGKMVDHDVYVLQRTTLDNTC